MPVFQLSEEILFPPPHLADESGLLAVGGDLCVDRLILAYQEGIFPWYGEEDPICWWSPNPRFVLFPKELHLTDRFVRFCKKSEWRVTLDQAFEHVIRNCSVTPRSEKGTWLLPEMCDAYRRLFTEKWAHSVEVWEGDQLIGGLYGVQMGSVFCGESMFHNVSDASKVALLALSVYANAIGVKVIDCQIPSDHLKRMGAKKLHRNAFLDYLPKSLNPIKANMRWDFQPIFSANSVTPLKLWNEFKQFV